MLKTNVYDMNGKQVGEVELSEAVFGIEPNESVVHDVVKNHLANCRQGTQSALTRAEVSGGGKKPWKQKGTGHARQGSTRAPQWTHGGIVFAPKPRDYSYTLNKKVRRLALKSVLSAKAQSADIVVIDEIKMDEIKTKKFAGFLSAVNADCKALVVTAEANENVVLSARNLPGVQTTFANLVNVYDVLNAKKLVLDKAALAKIEEVTAYDIIIRPVITEQSMEATELKKYVFLVAESANKTEIKKAVSEIFGVKVEKVTTIRMDGKLKRQGRYPAGRTASYKKAVVKLTADSKTIEFFEGMV